MWFKVTILAVLALSLAACWLTVDTGGHISFAACQPGQIAACQMPNGRIGHRICVTGHGFSSCEER